MKRPSEKNWFRFLRLIYALAFLFLLVVASVTAYGLSHPELGLVETNPLVRAYMSAYGLVVALLLATLVNASVLIFSGLFFTLYRMFQRRYTWHSPLIDAIAYALVATFGLYALIVWLLNAANDVYVLLFHSGHAVISTLWRFWENMMIYIMFAMFMILFAKCIQDLRRFKSPNEIGA
jgi:hypothetical protein